MGYIPVALEMYSVRNEFAENPWKTMKAVKAMGYEGVEFAGLPQFDPDFYAALLKESGLVCCGWHTPVEALLGDKFDATVKLNQAVGNKYAIVPWLDGESHEKWEENARTLNQISDNLAKYGMRTGYHNHAHDFNKVDGKATWDTFMALSSSRNVLQLDTGNALAGGANIMAELEKYPGRCKTIHLKPYSKDKGYEPLIGEDECPWKEIFQFCQTKGDTEWYIVEYECPAYPALEAVERCLNSVKTLL